VQNAVDLVANGQADIAVGVSPRWESADRVEYSLPYVQHSDRLLVPVQSPRPIEGFSDMKGTGWTIGYFADDAPDAEKIKSMAEEFGVANNIREPFAIQREQDAILIMIEQDNVHAIFGDSLRLLALTRGPDGDTVKMLDVNYGDILPITFAMPRNDADFRALVDFTLQDMAADGTYPRLWAEHFGLGDPVRFPMLPEASPDTR
jgi:ABC-type amino acid transport substrate-binding protein